MSPELFNARNVIVQGITGSHGTFHARAMVAAGTNIIAGTSPNKAGESVDGIPVYKSVADIQADHVVDISVIFVPARFAKSAILEAVDSKVPLIVCITEGIPIHDMLHIRQHLIGKSSTLIGPNSPGVLMPGVNKLGIIPAKLGLPGKAAIVSRSGTLTYEAVAGLTGRGIGQKYVIGIGGDQVRGTGFIECLDLFQNDPDVDQIIMVGEIGGTDEQAAAEHIAENITKPVYAYIAGHHAPVGVQLGHAGAILGSADESASAKTKALRDAGVTVSGSITELITSVRD
ncbi:MAG TPA: succinate--CoA ligase subunit alpha [Candidatus Saccharibacteria bacterium]|nr:succinate--CoA ligase subunit alpha [Candidatus Saccharibacteria bacterium]HRQ07103.1 succinate--CoA ligase subunit alpha [Candidatus Saccharibacteria bacterium]